MKNKKIVALFMIAIAIFIVCAIGIMQSNNGEKNIVLPERAITFFLWNDTTQEEDYVIEIVDGNKIESYYREYQGNISQIEKRKLNERMLNQQEIQTVSRLLDDISGKIETKGIAKSGWSYTVDDKHNILHESGIYGLGSAKENKAIKQLLEIAGLNQVILPANKTSDVLSFEPKQGFEIWVGAVYIKSHKIVFDGKGNADIFEIRLHLREHDSFAQEVSHLKRIQLPQKQWKSIMNLSKKINRIDSNTIGRMSSDAGLSFLVYQGKVQTPYGTVTDYEIDPSYSLLVKEVRKIIEETVTE